MIDHPASQWLLRHTEACIPAIQKLWAARGEHPSLLPGETLVVLTRHAGQTTLTLSPYDVASPPPGMYASPENAAHIAAALAEPDTIPVVAAYSPSEARRLGVNPMMAVSAPLP